MGYNVSPHHGVCSKERCAVVVAVVILTCRGQHTWRCRVCSLGFGDPVCAKRTRVCDTRVRTLTSSNRGSTVNRNTVRHAKRNACVHVQRAGSAGSACRGLGWCEPRPGLGYRLAETQTMNLRVARARAGVGCAGHTPPPSLLSHVRLVGVLVAHHRTCANAVGFCYSVLIWWPPTGR